MSEFKHKPNAVFVDFGGPMADWVPAGPEARQEPRPVQRFLGAFWLYLVFARLVRNLKTKF